MHVADQRTFHVVNAETVDHAVSDDRVGLVSDAGEEALVAGVRGVHVAVEHEALAVTRSFKATYDVCATVLNLLPGNLEPKLLEGGAHVLGHGELAACGTEDVDNVRAHCDDLVLADVGQDRVSDTVRQDGFTGGCHQCAAFPAAERCNTRKSSGKVHSFSLPFPVIQKLSSSRRPPPPGQ